MKLKNDPYFPFLALAILAGVALAIFSPNSVTVEHAPATPPNTITASTHALTLHE